MLYFCNLNMCNYILYILNLNFYRCILRPERRITRAPRSGEVINNLLDEPYSFKSDIWSLGCIVYELAALRPPFRSKNLELLNEKIQAGKIKICIYEFTFTCLILLGHYEKIPRHYS